MQAVVGQLLVLTSTDAANHVVNYADSQTWPRTFAWGSGESAQTAKSSILRMVPVLDALVVCWRAMCINMRIMLIYLDVHWHSESRSTWLG